MIDERETTSYKTENHAQRKILKKKINTCRYTYTVTIDNSYDITRVDILYTFLNRPTRVI